jgi:hypothetical protein
MSYGSETQANTLLPALTSGLALSVYTVDSDDPLLKVPATISDRMYQPVSAIDNTALTTRTVDGAGAFDALMASVNVHLKSEFDKNRITGAEYTKAYIALTQAAMQSAVQFVLGKDQAFWAAQQSQIAAITGRVQLGIAKIELTKTQLESLQVEANFALAKLRLATEDAQYGTAKYTLDNILPAQLAQANAQVTLSGAQTGLTASQQISQDTQNGISAYNLTYMLPQQLALATAQASTANYQLSYVIPAQLTLVTEQAQSQRAQTMDNRVDGTPVVGVLGKQKDLYTQQITSYQRDAETKATKLFTDAWVTQKTMDEGLSPPTNFTNTVMDVVLTKVRTNNGLT